MRHIFLSSLLSIAAFLSACSSSTSDGDVVTGSVVGTVVLAGAGPCAGVAVALDGARSLVATTDASGRFTFAPLPLGSYSVSATVPSTAELARTVEVQVTAGEPVQRATLVFTPIGTLTGTVTLAGVDPQPPLTVTLAGPATATTTTGATGAYAFGPIPLGEYRVSVAEPYTFEGSVSTTVQVAMGTTIAPSIQLTPFGTVSGTVTLAGLDPQPLLTVTLSGAVILTTITGPSGEYAFGAVPVGDYAVTAAEPSTMESSAAAFVQVTMGPITAPSLQLTPVGTISGTVVLAGLGPRAGLAVSFTGPAAGAGHTDGSGRYRFGPLPIGTYVVTVIEPYSLEGSASQTVDLGIGEAVVPDLDLTPTGRVGGRIVLTQTPPLAGLAVMLRTSPAMALAGSTVTDSDGAYVFPARLLGDYTISSSVPSTSESKLTLPVHLGFGMNTAPDLVFTALGSVDGTVALAGQSGAASAIVWAQGTNRAVVTDGTGAFALQGLAAGSYALSASRAGADTSTSLVDVVYATTVTANFVLAPTPPGQLGTGRLSGYASVLGLGPRGGITVSVDATSLSTVTAADGSWNIGGVPDGAWPLTLTDGVRTEHVPAAFALPGSDGFLLDGVLYPIGEIELQSAPRIMSQTAVALQLTSDGHVLMLDGTDLLSTRISGGPVVRIATNVQRVQAPATATGSRSWVAVFGTDGMVSAVPASGGPAIPIANLSVVTFDATGTVLIGQAADDSLWYAALERGDVRPVARGWTNSPGFPEYFTFTDPDTKEEGTVEYATGNVAMWGAVSVCDIRRAAGGHVVVQEMGAGPCYGRVLVGAPGAALTVIAPASSRLFNLSHSVSPDGRFVTVTSFDLTVSKEELILASIADGAVLRFEPDGYFLEWAPDSAHFTWSSRTAGLNLATSDGTTSRPVAQWAPIRIFSPDGAYLAFDDYRNTAVISTGDARTVAQLPASSMPFAFSPDSSVLITEGASIETVSLADGAVTFVTTLTSAIYESLVQLSPDGERFLFFSDDGLSSVPISGAPVTLLVPASTHAGGASVLAPTDAVLFESVDGFHFIPIDGGTIQNLGTRGAYPYGPSTSADGLTIAQLDAAGVLRTAALPTGTPGVVATGVIGYRRCDGGLVIAHTDQSLSVAPPTGPAAQVGTAVMSWSPAPGGWALFIDEAGRLFTAAVPTGVTSLLATDVPVLTWLGGAIRRDRVALVSGGVLQSAAVAGGPLTPHVRMEPALQNPWSWLDDRHGVAVRTGAPAPYRFQNGKYLVTVP